jgi:cytochrome c oxidase subunit 4
MAAATANHDGKGHIALATYWQILGLLLVLTVITVAAAQVDFGAMNTVIAMAIASVKAFFVLAFFMHLKYDNKLYIVCFFTAIFFLLVLYFFCWVDFYTRVSQGGIL